MIGVLPGPVLITRFLFPHALAVTLHETSGRSTTWAVRSNSKPLLLSSPRLKSRVMTASPGPAPSPTEPAIGTSTSASVETLS